MSEDIDARAVAAARLLADPLLTEAFETIRSEAIRAWQATGAKQSEEREIAWLTVKVLDRIEGVLNSAVDSGRISAARVQAPLR